MKCKQSKHYYHVEYSSIQKQLLPSGPSLLPTIVCPRCPSAKTTDRNPAPGYLVLLPAPLPLKELVNTKVWQGLRFFTNTAKPFFFRIGWEGPYYDAQADL